MTLYVYLTLFPHDDSCFQKSEGEVPLDTISAVNHLDDSENEPYQFEVMIERKNLWKLKASSEVVLSCSL